MNPKSPLRARIIVADDHAIVREGLMAIFHSQPEMKVVAEARNWLETIEKVRHHRPDVALTDLHMPGAAPEAIRTIRKISPNVKIIIFSAFDADEEVYQALVAGAHGYTLKGYSGREDLLACIGAVLKGKTSIHPSAAVKLANRMIRPSLTKREKEILQLTAEGNSNKEIGATLDVTEGTVKVHLNHIFAKLGVSGRSAAVAEALRHGIASLSGIEPSPAAAPEPKSKSKHTAA